jgi:archaellum biogenesis ATPase FlaH
MMQMSKRVQKKLAETTLRKQKILEEKHFYSSGIRELDEMLGGGFQSDTLTLFQQDIGSGGEVILRQIIKNQLSVSNVVLIILTDIISRSLIQSIQNENSTPDLIILDLVDRRMRNSDLFTNRHEISLQMRAAREKAVNYVIQKRDDVKDPSIQLFTVTISINPFLLNLSQSNVIQLIQDNLNQCCGTNTCDLVLLNKDIISSEMLAKIQSLCHVVVDLSSQFKGIYKQQFIRILKMVGHYLRDDRMEPYQIIYTENNEYSIVIKSAFLNTFETFRNLMEWDNGTLEFSNTPLLLLPIDSWMRFLKKIEDTNILTEVGKKIGEDLSSFIEEIYVIERWEALKTTLRIWSLLGWGESKMVKKEITQNLVEFNHVFHSAIREEIYIPILKGLYSGIVMQTLKLSVKYVDIKNKETDKLIKVSIIVVFG